MSADNFCCSLCQIDKQSDIHSERYIGGIFFLLLLRPYRVQKASLMHRPNRTLKDIENVRNPNKNTNDTLFVKYVFNVLCGAVRCGAVTARVC